MILGQAVPMSPRLNAMPFHFSAWVFWPAKGRAAAGVLLKKYFFDSFQRFPGKRLRHI